LHDNLAGNYTTVSDTFVVQEKTWKT
jgi:hypothetical protein